MTNTLAGKIAKVSRQVGALATDKTNEQQKYSYISADKVLDRAGDALAENGVVIFPSITNEDTTQADYTDSYGKAKMRFDAVVHFDMLIADGENELKLPWCGRGSDYASPDKALYKAITSGHKYFLMKLLNIGVGNEDGEHESEGEQKQAAKPAPNAQKPQNGTQAQHRNTAANKSDSPPHTRLWGIGKAVLGTDWDMARPWVIKQWTKNVTPDNVRSSASDLSDDEKSILGDYMNEKASTIQQLWPKQKAIMVQATVEAQAQPSAGVVA